MWTGPETFLSSPKALAHGRWDFSYFHLVICVELITLIHASVNEKISCAVPTILCSATLENERPISKGHMVSPSLFLFIMYLFNFIFFSHSCRYYQVYLDANKPYMDVNKTEIQMATTVTLFYSHHWVACM